MSISPEKKLETQEENIDKYKSDEPKNIQEQRSVGDPSTEIGSKKYIFNINSWYQ